MVWFKRIIHTYIYPYECILCMSKTKSIMLFFNMMSFFCLSLLFLLTNVFFCEYEQHDIFSSLLFDVLYLNSTYYYTVTLYINIIIIIATNIARHIIIMMSISSCVITNFHFQLHSAYQSLLNGLDSLVRNVHASVELFPVGS